MTSPSSALVVAISVAAHMAGAVVLGVIPASHAAPSRDPRPVSVMLSAPIPTLEPPAPPEPEPEIVAPEPVVPTIARRETPEPEPAPIPEAAPEIAPVAPVITAAPPSLDEVFGDPPPAPDALVAAGSGGAWAVAPGEGGPATGRAGGTGSAVGAGGSGGGEAAVDDAAERRRARLAYKRELERLLRARTSYPRAALRDRLEGRVELGLRIGHDGSVLAVRIAESSGYALLDGAAVDSARADRLPPPPPAAGLRESDELTVGVVYVVR